jgi:hypothetical protein
MAEIPKLLLSIHSSTGGMKESYNREYRRLRKFDIFEIESRNKSGKIAQSDEDDFDEADTEETSMGRFRRPTIFSGIRPEPSFGGFFGTRQTRDSSDIDAKIEKERQKNRMQRPNKPLPYHQAHIFETQNLILRNLRVEDILEYQLTNFIPEDQQFAAILSPNGSKKEINNRVREAIRQKRMELMVITKMKPRVNNYVPPLSVHGGIPIGLIEIHWPEKGNKGSRVQGFFEGPKEIKGIDHQVQALGAVFEYVLGVLGREAIYVEFTEQEEEWICLMKSLGLKQMEVLGKNTDGEMVTYEFGWKEWKKARVNISPVQFKTE